MRVIVNVKGQDYPGTKVEGKATDDGTEYVQLDAGVAANYPAASVREDKSWPPAGLEAKGA